MFSFIGPLSLWMHSLGLRSEESVDLYSLCYTLFYLLVLDLM